MSFAHRIASFLSPQAPVAGAADQEDSAPPSALPLGGEQHAAVTGGAQDIGFSGYSTGQDMRSKDGEDLEEEGRPPYLHVCGTSFGLVTLLMHTRTHAHQSRYDRVAN